MLSPNLATILGKLCSITRLWPLFNPNTWQFLPVFRKTPCFWVKLGSQIFQDIRSCHAGTLLNAPWSSFLPNTNTLHINLQSWPGLQTRSRASLSKFGSNFLIWGSETPTIIFTIIVLTLRPELSFPILQIVWAVPSILSCDHTCHITIKPHDRIGAT